MDWTLGFAGIILLTVGLIGQALEMRRIRKTTYKDEDLGSANIFLDKRNIKWYAILGIGIVLWYTAERV